MNVSYNLKPRTTDIASTADYMFASEAEKERAIARIGTKSPYNLHAWISVGHEVKQCVRCLIYKSTIYSPNRKPIGYIFQMPGWPPYGRPNTPKCRRFGMVAGRR